MGEITEDEQIILMLVEDFNNYVEQEGITREEALLRFDCIVCQFREMLDDQETN